MAGRALASAALAALLALLAASLVAAAQLPSLPVKIRGALHVEKVNLTFIVYSDGGVQLAYAARGYLEAAGIPSGVNISYHSETSASNNRYLSVVTLALRAPLRLGRIHVEPFALDTKASITLGNGASVAGVMYVTKGGETRRIEYRVKATPEKVVYTLKGVECSSRLVEALEEIPGVEAECSNGVLTATLDTGRLYAWLRSRGLTDQEIEAINTLLTTRYHVLGGLYLRVNVTPEANGVAMSLEYRLGLEGGSVGRLLVDLARAELPIYHAALALLQHLAERSGAEQLAEQLSKALTALSLTAAPPKLLPKPPYEAKTTVDLESRDGRLYFEVDALSTKLVYVGGGTPAEKAREVLRIFAEELAQLKLVAGLLSTYISGATSLIPSVVYVKPGDSRVSVSPEKVPLDELPKVEIRVAPRPTTTATSSPGAPRTSSHAWRHAEEQTHPTYTREHVYGHVGPTTSPYSTASPGASAAAPQGQNLLVYTLAAAAIGGLVGAAAAMLAVRRR